MSPPVRKGDGTPVVPQDIAEVRTGDGRVLFGGAIPDSSKSRPSDNDSGDAGTSGLKFSVNAEFTKFQAEISSNTVTNSSSTAEIYTLSNDSFDTVIGSVDASSASAGDVLTFDSLSQNIVDGTNYAVVFADFDTTGFYNSASFPYASSDNNVTIEAGFNTALGGNVDTSNAFNFVTIGNINL